jgi:hypothetical protein
MRIRLKSAAIVLMLAAAACQSVATPTAPPSPEPLRTSPSIPPGVDVLCTSALIVGRLAADQTDPARVWLVADDGGDRVELIWPYGFRVQFTPQAEVLAPDGEVVARESEAVELGGGNAVGQFEVCSVNGRDLLG